MVEKLNVHFYDTKIKEFILTNQQISEEIIGAHSIPKEEKIRIFSELRCLIDNATKHTYDIVINDFISESSNNFDPLNEIYASDMLFLCHKYILPDNINILNDQLIDLASGLCAQGRSTRFFQVYFSIRR